MAHTLLMFSEAKTCPAYTHCNLAVDQSMTPTTDGVSVPAGWNHILGAYALSVHLVRARIVSPSLRKWANHYISPVDAAANPPTSPAFQHYDYDVSIPVTVGDDLQFEFDNASTTNERTDGLLWLGTGPIQEVHGTIFSVGFTSATTVPANAWTLGTLTPETSLEAGLYQVVGMWAHFCGAVAARLVFPGALNAIRPGVIASTTANLQMHPAFRFGELGIWGIFNGAVLPQCEFWGAAGSTTQRVVLDLVKGPTGISLQQAAQGMFGPVYTTYAEHG